jgi:hypothetical protein
MEAGSEFRIRHGLVDPIENVGARVPPLRRLRDDDHGAMEVGA